MYYCSKLLAICYCYRRQFIFLFFLLFLLIAGLSLNYAFLKLLIWSGAAFFIISRLKPVFIFGTIMIVGFLESVLAFLQFWKQESLGLESFGESVLSADNLELARIFLDPGLLLRAYGTFPHPNILAAFLVLSLIACCYFYINNKSWRRLLVIVIFVNILGLTVTFARVGWLIAAVAVAGFVLLVYRFNFEWRVLRQLLLVLLVSLLVIFSILHWAIIPRLAGLTFDNFTVQNRISDYQWAFELISEKPWLGHGLTLAIGERPIHNLYLLIAVELGLVGLLFFLLFLSAFYWQGAFPWDYYVVLIMLSALLLYGLSDHFLWTLRPGIGMFWVIISVLLHHLMFKTTDSGSWYTSKKICE